MTEQFWTLLATSAGILALVICSAFFSGSETALTAASKARMNALRKSGDPRANAVLALIEERGEMIGALLLGNNLVNVFASALATSLFLEWFGAGGIALATLAMTAIIVVFAEVTPKSWAIAAPDRFALAVARPVRWAVLLLSPFADVVAFAVRWILRCLGIRLDASHSILSAHEEIRGTVEELAQGGGMFKAVRERIGGVLDLHELAISDVMLHRTKMFMVNCEDPPEKIIKLVVDSPFTRIPVWRGNIENIVGILHAKDLLRHVVKVEDRSGIDMNQVISKPWFVPESTSLQDQLNAFLRRKEHIAMAVDEYGEVMGLVTLEDILEEIVGEIADEHDVEVMGLVRQPDGSLIVDGGVPVRDLNRALDWSLPDEEATTIAGLVIHAAQTIPEEKQAFTFYGKRFVVLERKKNRITRLQIR